jgi:VWFA-related protein
MVTAEVNVRRILELLPAVLYCLLCCFLSPGFAQQTASPPPVPPPAERPTVSTGGPDRSITLDVVVTDKSGKPVAGLQQQDFTLLDDKQPQKIVSFQATSIPPDESTGAPDSPVQAILLIDAVNTSYHSVGYERQQLQKFLQQNGGKLALPTSLVLMTDTSQAQSDATRDGNALVESLNSNQSGLRIIIRSQGFYGGADRVQISLNTLGNLAAHLATEPGRKLVIWLSPGWPLLSGPNVQLSAKDQAWLFQTVVQLSDELRAARITLYNVDPLGMDESLGRTFYYQSFLKGLSSAKQAQNGNLGLQVLAAQSGGTVLTSSNDIAKLVASCVTDATAYYTLSFDSPPADHPNEYHSLQVKIDKPGLTARTRTGYYAQK